MKITLKNTPEQIELVKAMASRNRTVAYDAQSALAAFMGPILANVINQAPTLSNLFTSLPFDSEDNPSIPLDLYFDINAEDYITVWSQSSAGGLPTNQVTPTTSELKIATYTLDSAVSFDRKYAAKHRMDVVAKSFTRMAQEFLLKQERTSAAMVMSALANASSSGKAHVQRANLAGSFVLADLNELLTLGKRLTGSWAGGTAVAGAQRVAVSDILVSPEIVEELRAMAYNPINTKAAPYTSSLKDSIAAPDELRMEAFRAAGAPNFYGVNILEFNEFGVGQKFNTVFDVAAGSTTYARPDGTTGAAVFNGATEQILVGIDRNRDSLMRVVATDADAKGSELVLQADDQFVGRSGKVGFFGGLEEGRMILDIRALVGKIV